MFRRYNLARKQALLVDEELGFGLTLPQGYSKTQEGKWLAGDLKDWYWQVSYMFPEDLRSNIFNGYTYGSSDMTMRRLYEILSGTFIKKPFLDYYFTEVFPVLKQEFERSLNELKSAVLRTLGVSIDSIEEALDEASLANIGLEFAQEIKEDIKTSLKTGRIPFQFELKESTKEKRKKIGIIGDNPFYVTGQLIDSVVVICEIRNKKWKSKDFSFYDLLFGG